MFVVIYIYIYIYIYIVLFCRQRGLRPGQFLMKKHVFEIILAIICVYIYIYIYIFFFLYIYTHIYIYIWFLVSEPGKIGIRWFCSSFWYGMESFEKSGLEIEISGRNLHFGGDGMGRKANKLFKQIIVRLEL